MSKAPRDNPYTTPADIIAAIQSGRQPLSSVDCSLRTAELCEAAVRHDADNLRDVPFSLITPELCALALADNGLLLESIPESFRTEQLCLKAVHQSGHALRSVPESMRTAEIVDVAVGQWGRALTWVPESMRTLELCERAVAEDGSALEFVPLQLKSRKLCRQAVTHKVRRGAGSGLEYATAEEKNYWLCAMSVFHKPLSLRAVPMELRSLEICALALRLRDDAKGLVPLDLLGSPELTERLAQVRMAEDNIDFLENEVRQALSPFIMRHNIWWDAQDRWERMQHEQSAPKPSFAHPWLDKLNWLKREKDSESYTWTKLCSWD
jgi:hypothetical protein